MGYVTFALVPRVLAIEAKNIPGIASVVTLCSTAGHE